MAYTKLIHEWHIIKASCEKWERKKFIDLDGDAALESDDPGGRRCPRCFKLCERGDDCRICRGKPEGFRHAVSRWDAMGNERK